jgi:phosphopantothenoylcysteine decarboxylase/phosphopantothenate--cysteine ligase
VLVGFAAETDDLVRNAQRKLASKHLDLIVANNVAEPDAGFEVDTNRAVILDTAGNADPAPLQSKTDLAGVILDRVADLLRTRRPE